MAKSGVGSGRMFRYVQLPISGRTMHVASWKGSFRTVIEDTNIQMTKKEMGIHDTFLNARFVCA